MNFFYPLEYVDFLGSKKLAVYLGKRPGNEHGYLPNPVPGIGQNLHLYQKCG